MPILCGRLFPAPVRSPLSSLIKEAPASLPASHGSGAVLSATSGKPSLNKMAACLSQKVPFSEARCLECLSVPKSMTPRVSLFSGLCHSQRTVIVRDRSCNHPHLHGCQHCRVQNCCTRSPVGCKGAAGSCAGVRIPRNWRWVPRSTHLQVV